jgi:hypothetical protein
MTLVVQMNPVVINLISLFSTEVERNNINTRYFRKIKFLNYVFSSRGLMNTGLCLNDLRKMTLRNLQNGALNGKYDWI